MDKQGALLKFVKKAHKGQTRRGGEPYYRHLLRVAQHASDFCPYGYEIGICHDLLEDTDVTAMELRGKLKELGYINDAISLIMESVIELTNKFTSKDLPEINRAIRKKMESKRLGNMTPRSQTVKYLDIIDNIGTIVKVDPKFAKLYCTEKFKDIMRMEDGNPQARMECLEVLAGVLVKLINK